MNVHEMCIDERTGEEFVVPVLVRAMQGRRVRAPYFRERFLTAVGTVSRTHQSHAASVDVNNIVERYLRTGVLPPDQGVPMYGDVSMLNAPLGELLQRADDVLSRARAFQATWQPPAHPQGGPAVGGGVPAQPAVSGAPSGAPAPGPSGTVPTS